MGQPSRAALHAIEATRPLTASPHRGEDPLRACNVCGEPAVAFRLYRECDQRDRPIPGRGFLLFVGLGRDHKACEQTVTDHPRLYTNHPGVPGCFPRLCGPCVVRRDLTCTHPKLKANGGDGLIVRLPGPKGFICGRGGCHNLNNDRTAIRCEGRRTLRLVAADSTGSAA